MKRKAFSFGFAGLSGLALFGAILSGTRHAPAYADASNYTNQRRQIRACVLVSGAAQDIGAGNGIAPSNTEPYVFYAMDKGNDLKPAGLEFVNPLAPSSITQETYNRWRNRVPNGGTDRAFVNGTSEASVFQVGQPVAKNMAAYWEVNLDSLSAQTLQQFDVVYIPLHGGRDPRAPANVVGSLHDVKFTATERERLRRYVDGGGTIWLENAGEPKDAFAQSPGELAESFFLWLNTMPGPSATGNVSIVSSHHPLVNYPYQFTQQDAYSLGLYNPTNAAFAGYPTRGGSRPLNFAALPIINKTNGNGSVTTVWAGDYGAGHVMVTSATIGGDINNYLLSGNANGSAGSSVVGANDGAVSGDNLGNIPAADMKLAYNMVSWISSVPTPGSNQRRTGSTTDNIGSILGLKWSPIPITSANPIEKATVAAGNPGSGATMYKGMAFWVDGNNWMHAYNVNPGLSLNGNSNVPDGGITDFAYGASYDQIWTDSGSILGNPSNTRASTPTIISQYDGTAGGNGTTYEVAVVSTTDGATHFYNAFPRLGGVLDNKNSTAFKSVTSGGSLKPALDPSGSGGGAAIPSAGLPYGQSSPKPVPAPAYSDGILFTLVFSKPLGSAGQLGWRIAPIDLLTSLQNGPTGDAVSIFDNNIKTNADTHTLAPSADFMGMGLPGYNAPNGSLAVGEVQSTETDAVDRVVYVSVAADGSNQPQAGAVHGVWFSTRNETLKPDPTDPMGKTFRPNANRARVPWYTTTGKTSSVNLMPVIHVIAHQSATDNTIVAQNEYYYPADFDISYAPEATQPPQPPSGNHNVRVIFHNTITPPRAFDDVRVDYTVDWPGDTVGNVSANTPSPEDMRIIANTRTFSLMTPNPAQMLSETTGGATLSALDNLLYTVTNMHDQSGGAGGNTPPVEDRIACGRDQYLTASPLGPPRGSGNVVNWTFAPAPARQFDGTYGAGFDNYQSQPRLTYQGKPIYNFKAVGPPISYNGTVYAVGMGFGNAPGTGAAQPDYTVILALRENIDATLDLGIITDELNTIQLVQPSVLEPQNVITLQYGRDFSAEKVQDPVSGMYKTIAHIDNFQPMGSRDAFNTALPIWIKATSAMGGGAKFGGPILNPATGFGPTDNLISYVVIPRNASGSDSSGSKLSAGLVPTSGPSISGNTLYFAADVGYRNGGAVPSTIVSVDLLRSTGIQGDYQDASKNFVVTMPQSDVFTDLVSRQALNTVMPSVCPPLGSANVMLAPNAQNLVGLDNGLLLIADSHRLLEVDAGGNAAWSMESTLTQTLTGGNTLQNSGQALKSIGLAHPNTATRSSLNEFLIADTGNNRIVSANRGATTRYEVAGFQDGIKFLPPGEPITLNAPTDVQTFAETYAANTFTLTNRNTGETFTYPGACTVYHYLIADSGNYRIVDIADIYDNTTGNFIGMTGSKGTGVGGEKLLIFVSRSLGEQNQRLRYRTIQQFRQDGYDYIIACVGNVRQGNTGGVGVLGNDNTNFEGPGGSIMAIQRTANDPANTNGQIGDTVRVVNSIIVNNTDGSQRRQAISNPTWFKEYGAFDPQAPATTGKITPHFLLADANGCYVLKIGSVTINGKTTQEYVTDWVLTNQDYSYMTGRKLQATCIQRETLSDISSRNLFEPRFIITNAYSGSDDIKNLFSFIQQSDVITGEVFEIKSSDYFTAAGKNYLGYQFPNARRYMAQGINDGTLPGGILPTITRMIPTEKPVKNAAGNLIGIRRAIGSADNSLTTYSLQQPQYAERPF